jgi:pantoate--beta-alanine ligase
VQGLALSSRNMRLTLSEQEKASAIFKTISQAKSAQEASELLTQEGFIVDYVEDVEDRRYVAATLASVRLIDNVKI